MKTYQKLSTEFYDLEPHRDGAASLTFYLQRAHEAAGKILEPMCGTGRFLIPMLQAGLQVEGFDASAYMLAALSKNYARISQDHPPVWQSRVENFHSETRYKLIFVPYGSWGLIIDIDSVKKCLAAMYDCLLPGGKFIIEIETVASVPQPCGILRRGVHTRSDGSKIAINSLAIFDEESQIFNATCRYESIVDGVVDEVEHEEFLMYLYHFHEMDKLLRDVGFIHIAKYQDYKLNLAVDRDAHILIYEVMK